MTGSQPDARRRGPNRATIARNEEILRRFDESGNAAQVARDMGLPLGVAQHVVRRRRGPRIQTGPRPHLRTLTPERVADILRRFGECGNALQTADDLGIPRNQVWLTLKAHPEARREFRAKRNEEVLRHFNECGGNVTRVSQLVGLSIYTVRGIVNHANDPVGQEMKVRYESDLTLTVTDISAEFGFKYGKTLRMLHAAGTEIRGPGGSESGRNTKATPTRKEN